MGSRSLDLTILELIVEMPQLVSEYKDLLTALTDGNDETPSEYPKCTLKLLPQGTRLFSDNEDNISVTIENGRISYIKDGTTGPPMKLSPVLYTHEDIFYDSDNHPDEIKINIGKLLPVSGLDLYMLNDASGGTFSADVVLHIGDMLFYRTVEQQIITTMELGILNGSTFRAVEYIKPNQMLTAQIIISNADPLSSHDCLKCTLTSYDSNGNEITQLEGHAPPSIEIEFTRNSDMVIDGFHVYRSNDDIIPYLSSNYDSSFSEIGKFIHIEDNGTLQFGQIQSMTCNQQ